MAKYLTDRLFEERFCCVLCGNEYVGANEYGLCAKCSHEIPINNGYRCPKCGRPQTGGDLFCLNCTETELLFDRVSAPLVYTGSVETMLREYKFYGREYLAHSLAVYLRWECQTHNIDYDIITYVPTYEERRADWVPGRQIAYEFAKLVGKPIVQAVEKTRPTPKQHDLGRTDRLKNLEKAFALTDRTAYRGKKVLIVDDIITTGCTMSEVARAIRHARPLAVCGVAVAIAVPTLTLPDQT